MAKKIKVSGRKPKNKIIRIITKVIYRIFEGLADFVFCSLFSLTAGGIILPSIAYELSAGCGLKSNTNTWLGLASWGFPMLFFTLIIASLSIFVMKKYVNFVHGRFNKLIEKAVADEDKNQKGE